MENGGGSCKNYLVVGGVTKYSKLGSSSCDNYHMIFDFDCNFLRSFILLLLFLNGRKKFMAKKIEKRFTLEYWQDNGWLVGRLREVPGVFSQGKTRKELIENITDAYHLMIREYKALVPSKKVKTLEFAV